MKLEEAIEIVLREARSNGIGGLADDQTLTICTMPDDWKLRVWWRTSL